MSLKGELFNKEGGGNSAHSQQIKYHYPQLNSATYILYKTSQNCSSFSFHKADLRHRVFV